MSPSWTKALRPAPACLAGIAIGRNEVCAVVLTPGADRPQLHSVRSQALRGTLFEGTPDDAAEEMLVRALVAVSAEFKNLYAAVHVAVPDTVLRSSVLELDEVPRKAQVRQTLLRWRLAREWQRAEEALECQGADLERDGDARLIFAQAGDRAWLACLRQAFARAGVMVWSMNAALVHRFNVFHDQIAGAAAALLALDPDSWSLMVWDDAGRPRQVFTRLRGGQPSDDDAESIADEAERLILAYVQADSRRRVGRLHLAGGASDLAALASVLDGRLQDAAIQVHPDAYIVDSQRNSDLRNGLATQALAAALNP